MSVQIECLSCKELFYTRQVVVVQSITKNAWTELKSGNMFTIFCKSCYRKNKIEVK